MSLTHKRHPDVELARATLLGGSPHTDLFLHRMRCIPRFLRALARSRARHVSEEDLRDLCQETLARVWARLADYKGRATLESWVHSFCVLVLTERRRARDRVSRESERALDACTREGLGADEARAVRRALDELPDELGEVLRLRHFEELKFREIAQRLETPSSTLKSRYQRGIEQLHRRLRRHFGE